jgi:hypothetical protein
MEQYQCIVEGITRSSDTTYLVNVLVTRRVELTDSETTLSQIYRLELDIATSSMSPVDELGDCFAVYSDHEDGSVLNPRLRRQWYTACAVDQLVGQIFSTGVLQPTTV